MQICAAFPVRRTSQIRRSNAVACVFHGRHELCETLELIYERLSSFERRHISSAAPYAFNQENVSLLGSERIHLLKLLAAIDPTRQQRYKELLDREHFFDRYRSDR